ncbi:MAG: glycogen synthase GlgA [Lachnospiraceae bacterium]|nr:glycogen synthase GlgA [Candidatus Minthocola equi]
MKKILFTAAECVPFVKTGGLSDVIGSLPKYFDKKKYDVRVILPKYLCISEKFRDNMECIGSFYTFYNGRDRYVGIMRLVLDGVTFYFIDNEEYFGGNFPYGDLLWDLEKFGFFSYAVLAALPSMDFCPDIIHCNDWHTGLLPVYLKTTYAADSFYQNIKAIMTIHNLRFQGTWDIETVKKITGLPDYLFTGDKLEFFKDANYLKGGLVYADYITTVSSSYAEEIKTPFYGEKLDGLLWARRDSSCGIVNGIDVHDFNPETDLALTCNYNSETFKENKKKNKLALQKELGLREDPKALLIGIVSRMTDQKGFDLVQRVFEEMLGDYVQFAILGTGEARYEDMFKQYASQYPNQVSANIFYSEALSRRIYAGSDAFLMPSLFEPCGLSQLIALRYGSVPIVRETGGLRDTVIPYNEYKNEGTGFSFANYNAHEMMATVRYAERIFYDHKRRWNELVKRGMEQDFSWTASARKYQDLYDRLLKS